MEKEEEEMKRMNRNRRRRKEEKKKGKENSEKKIWTHSQNVVSETSGAEPFLRPFQGIQKVKVVI